MNNMLENTSKNTEIIISQLRSIDIIRRLLTLVLYSAYIIYRLAVGGGYLALNVCLLVLTLGYLGFYVYYISTDKKAFSAKTSTIIKIVYRWSKLLFTGIGIGLNVAGFLSMSTDMNITNFVFCVLLPVFFLLQLVCELLFDYLIYCVNLIKTGVCEDLDKLKKTYEKPIQAVTGVKDTIAGFNNIKNGFSSLAKAVFTKKGTHKKEEPKKEEEVEVVSTEEDPTPVPQITDGTETITIDEKDII